MKVIFFDECDSTNRQAFLLGEQGAEHGTAVIAKTQKAGRGRLGRAWQSPPGRGLYCSTILRPDLASEEFPRLTFPAGLAVALTIEQYCGLRPGLKWPNDIYYDRRKCGGILTEASGLTGKKEHRFAVIGIGLNINTRVDEFPADVRDKATSLYLLTGRNYDITEYFTVLHSMLLEQVRWLENNTFTSVLERWKEYDVLRDKRMIWINVQGERIEGVSLGPDDTGRLHVKDGCGIIHQVLSGDIELDCTNVKSAAGS